MDNKLYRLEWHDGKTRRSASCRGKTATLEAARALPFWATSVAIDGQPVKDHPFGEELWLSSPPA